MNLLSVKEVFTQAEAIIINDHFVYAKKADGWYHGRDYVNKDAIYPFTKSVSTLCRYIEEWFRLDNIQVVVGPTVGGVSLSQWVAYWLSEYGSEEVLAVYADEEDITENYELDTDSVRRLGLSFGFIASGQVEIQLSVNSGGIERIDYKAKVGNRRVIKRGYEKKVNGRRCLVVEDIINSGLTVKKTIEAIQEVGGEVIGVGALCNRSGGKVTVETFGVPQLFSLLDLDMVMYPESSCPICQERGLESVRTDLGKGKEFLIRIGRA